MLLSFLILFVLFLVAFWIGFRRLLRLEHLSRSRVINGFLAAMVLLTILSAAHWMGVVPERSAAHITMGLYSAVSGFFFGFGIALYRLRGPAGTMLYVCRSVWSDLVPNLIAVALFVYGLHRLGVVPWGPFTGIGITSGLSLMGFAFFGWTVRVVPEFRSSGILLLDQFVAWEQVLAWEWTGVETLKIDYLTEKNAISEFRTRIPAEDRNLLERILEEKMEEHTEERRQLISESREG